MPILRSLHNDLKERIFYGAKLVIEALPTIKLDSNQLSHENFFNPESTASDKFNQLMFGNPIYLNIHILNILKHLLPFFYKHKYLDINE